MYLLTWSLTVSNFMEQSVLRSFGNEEYPYTPDFQNLTTRFWGRFYCSAEDNECFTIIEIMHRLFRSSMFTLFSFSLSDFCWKPINILTYLIKYSKLLPCTMDQKIICVKKNKQNDSSSKSLKEVRFQHISKLELDFQVVQEHWSSGHLQKSESNGLLITWVPYNNLITQEEYACVINIFAPYIQQCS